MKENDYTPRPKHVIDISGDPRALDANARHELVKLEFGQMKEAARWKSLHRVERGWERAVEVYDMARNLAYSIDDSMLGRQGWFFMMAHPDKWLEAGVDSVKAVDRRQSRKQGAEFKQLKNARNGLYKKMGIEFNDISATGDVSEADDMFRIGLTHQIPLIGDRVVGPAVDASARAYAAASNKIRREFGDILLNNTKRGRRIQADPTNLSKEDLEHLKHLGWGVNVLSGRGTMKHAEGASRVLGAPRFMKAAFDTILHRPILNPLLTGDYQAAGAFAKEYLRVYATVAAIYIMANLFLDDDEEIEWDPRSSKWADIPIHLPFMPKGYAWNPLAAISPQLRFLARGITGQKKTGSGIVNLRDSWLPVNAVRKMLGLPPEKQKTFYGQNQWSDLGQYLRTKLHPGLNGAIGLLVGTDFWGNERSRWRLLADSFTPISPGQTVEAGQAKGAVAGVVVGGMEFFGLTTKPDYSDPDVLRSVASSDKVFEESARKRLYSAAAPGASSDDRTRMRKFLSVMKESGTKDAEIFAMLDAERKARGESVRQSKKGVLTSYGRRVRQVKTILAGKDDSAWDASNALYKATEESASAEEKADAAKLVAGMSWNERRRVLRMALKRHGTKTEVGPAKSPSAYDQRVIRLKKLESN